MYIELICIITIIILLAVSQGLIESVYRKYSNVRSEKELTGKDIAERMLLRNGVNDVQFGTVNGSLTDYYNPKSKKIHFSKQSFTSNDIAAIAVAAHETGHAIQHHTGYFMMKIRGLLAPICSLSAKLVWVFIFIGFLFSALNFFMIGIALMGVTIVFQLITLPVEFDASNRAIAFLEAEGYSKETMVGVRKMLKAAAFTYVASTLAAILQLIRLVAAFSRDD